MIKYDIRYGNNKYMSVNNNIHFNILKKNIHDHTGIDCNKYKNNYLQRRVSLRMKELKVPSYNMYCKFLKNNKNEYKHLMDGVTINVTEFFRDKETYDYIQNKLIPDIISNKINRNNKTIRIWSAGCSIGMEPYSIGIILHELFGSKINDFKIYILATDLDKEALNAAKKGVYNQSVIKNINKFTIQKYFDIERSESSVKYIIKDKVKNFVKFHRHDLFSDSKYSHFDLILCRNVMIYFTKELQNTLMSEFHDSLNSNGYLIIGKTESMMGNINNKYLCINSREKIYQKN